MKRIIVLGVCLALSQIGLAELTLNPDGTATMKWGGEAGLNKAKQIMYQNPNISYRDRSSYKADTTSSDEDNYQPNWETPKTKNIQNDKDWVQVANNPNADIFVAPKTIAENELGYKTIWMMTIAKKPNAKTHFTKVFKAVLVADCKAQKIGYENINAVTKSGKEVHDFDNIENYKVMRYVEPDNTYYQIMQSICEK